MNEPEVSSPMAPQEYVASHELTKRLKTLGMTAGQRVEVNKALASAGRGFPVGIAGPRRRAFGGA
jgi:Fe2+ transport system protein FeoA